MSYHHHLTNEKLSRKFANSFELVNAAIKRGREMLAVDRPCLVHTKIQNRAFQVLLEIESGIEAPPPEFYDEIDEEVED
jgi:hypothetical protein